MSHDQNFKNLILDYPHQALAFFAAEEAADRLAGAEILPVRQEQLKNRLGDRFRELDVPLLVRWPDGRRELKYLDFIDIYADLDEADRARYRREYPDEAEIMGTFSERFIRQGMEQGMEQGERLGLRTGEARVLLAQLQLKFGDIPEAIRLQIDRADAELLLQWSTRILTATRIEEVVGHPG